MSGYTVRIGFPRSQTFSSEGCAGVGETSSVATIGMILEAKKDIRLNCIEDAQAEPAAPAPENSGESAPAEETSTTTLFDDTEIIIPKKKKKEPSKIIQWMKQQGRKMSSAAEDAFDNTVGGLFDNMQ